MGEIVTVRDVASYILSKCGAMSAMKLQKLVYYGQAWSLVWDDEPLFPEQIQAWRDGPVVPRLYVLHRGMYVVSRGDIKGDPDKLTRDQRETLDAVISSYGTFDGATLSRMAHSERPWIQARGDLPESEPCMTTITHEEMKAFYGSL